MSKVLLGPNGRPVSQPRSLDEALHSDLPDPARRWFTKLAGSSILALPMLSPRALQANNPEENEERLAVIEQLFIRNPQLGRVILTGILVVMATGVMYYANVSQGALQFGENRLATSNILGGLTRPTILERLAVATAVGNVYLWGTILVIFMAAGVSFNPAALTFLFVHRNLSWEVTNMARIGGLEGLPSFAEIQATAVIATCFYMATMSMLMCFVPPPGYRT